MRFLHADSEGDDFMDNGLSDGSNLPVQYRKGMGTHGDHYHISQGAIFNPTDKRVQNWTINGFNILKNASKNWGLNFSNTAIKTQMWSFSGSLVKVNQTTGKLEYNGKN